MYLPRLNARLASLALISVMLTLSSVALAQGQSSRFAETYTHRVQLQKDIKDALEQTLHRISHPYDVMATVEIQMQGEISEKITKETQPGLEMKMESKKSVKLPGLPKTTLPNAKADSPNISFKIPSHDKVEISQQLNSIITKVAVRLYVEDGIPDKQMEQVKSAAHEIAGLDLERGDTLETIIMAPYTAQRSATLHPVMLAQRSVWLACITFLLATIILSLALAKGKRGASQLVGDITGSVSGAGAALGAADDDVEDALMPGLEPGASGPAGAAASSGHVKHGAFASLYNVSGDQLLELLEMLDGSVVATILDQVAILPETVAKLFETIPENQHLAIMQQLGQRRVVPMEDIRAMESKAEAALEKVRSRIAIGSTARLADILGEAPEATMQSLLDQLSKTDATLGEQVRKNMVLFEDLAGFDRLWIRQVVAHVDPTTMSHALYGADKALHETIKAAVSKRLLRILDAEQEAMGEIADEAVSVARKKVEMSMRRVARAAR